MSKHYYYYYISAALILRGPDIHKLYFFERTYHVDIEDTSNNLAFCLSINNMGLLNFLCVTNTAKMPYYTTIHEM